MQEIVSSSQYKVSLCAHTGATSPVNICMREYRYEKHYNFGFTVRSQILWF